MSASKSAEFRVTCFKKTWKEMQRLLLYSSAFFQFKEKKKLINELDKCIFTMLSQCSKVKKKQRQIWTNPVQIFKVCVCVYVCVCMYIVKNNISSNNIVYLQGFKYACFLPPSLPLLLLIKPKWSNFIKYMEFIRLSWSNTLVEVYWSISIFKSFVWENEKLYMRSR